MFAYEYAIKCSPTCLFGCLFEGKLSDNDVGRETSHGQGMSWGYDAFGPLMSSVDNPKVYTIITAPLFTHGPQQLHQDLGNLGWIFGDCFWQNHGIGLILHCHLTSQPNILWQSQIQTTTPPLDPLKIHMIHSDCIEFFTDVVTGIKIEISRFFSYLLLAKCDILLWYASICFYMIYCHDVNLYALAALDRFHWRFYSVIYISKLFKYWR